MIKIHYACQTSPLGGNDGCYWLEGAPNKQSFSVRHHGKSDAEAMAVQAALAHDKDVLLYYGLPSRNRWRASGVKHALDGLVVDDGTHE